MNENGRISLNGEKIKKSRQKMILSREMFVQKSIEQKCYMSISTLKRAESGAKVYYNTAIDIAKVLKVEVTELLTEETQLEPTRFITRTILLQDSTEFLNDNLNKQKNSLIYLKGEAGIGKTHFIKKFINSLSPNSYQRIYLTVQIRQTTKPDLIKNLLKQLLFKIKPHTLDNTLSIEQAIKSLNISIQFKNYLNKILQTKHQSPIIGVDFSDKVYLETELILTLCHSLSTNAIIIFEDLHFAPQNVLDFLKILISQAHKYFCDFIFSSRLTGDPSDLLLNSNVLNINCKTIELDKLSDVEIKSITDTSPQISEEYKNTCISLADGNPLFLEMLLNQYPQVLETIPPTLSILIKEKLLLFSNNELKFIKTASAMTGTFSLESIKKICSFDEFNPARTVELKFFKQLDNDSFTFYHGLVHLIVYRNIPPIEKVSIHKNIAQHFQSLDKNNYAYHLEKSMMLKDASIILEGSAKSLIDQQEYSEALLKVNTAISLQVNTRSFSLFFLKGTLLKLLNIPTKAIKVLNIALSLSQKNEDLIKTYLELIEIYLINRRTDKAHDMLKKALEIHYETDSDKIRLKLKKFEKHIANLNASMYEMNKELDYSCPDSLNNLIASVPKPINCINLKNSSGHYKVGLVNCDKIKDGVLKTSIMALDEINFNGGLLNKQIKYEIFDDFTQLTKKKIHTIISCSTSNTKALVEDINNHNDSLTIYPFNHEGMEHLNNVLYTGSTSNLNSSPLIDWFVNKKDSDTFYLLGSDDIQPIIINKHLTETIKSYGCTILAEQYAALDELNFDRIVADIKRQRPAVIIITLTSLASNISFLKKFHDCGLADLNIKVAPLNLTDDDLVKIPHEYCIGLYGIGNYFQNNNNPINDNFIQRYKSKYNNHDRIGRFMESAYCGIQLWAKAVQRAQSFSLEKIKVSLRGSSFLGPGGLTYIDENNDYIWRHVHIAHVEDDGEYHIKWTSPRPISPQLRPRTKTKSEWSNFLRKTKARWDTN
ncbi:transporter substrate-binding protein [Lentisphaera profundi]|uniref:Transporter substrate-binding protein n=1 Tax=Lentisphaera profundi TaxID=1658616 RepID=A0ABY7VSC2_9BACT|nr:transporter substrate-binding protein [Lentisphaera profundi]WDE96622.1 transporter substrate-binding protein [Lentisphaera profundi]